MARPQKEGLDYFPLDVDMDQDDKVALIEAQHGLVGFGVVIKLLMKIYKNSYYYKWTEKEQLLFSKRVNVDINQVNVIINDCVKWSLFDAKTLETHAVLTSRGIQRRYLSAIGRRQKVEMAKEYLLLDAETVNAYKNLVIVDTNPTSSIVNVDINPQRKEKESKEKKRKEIIMSENKFSDDSIPITLSKLLYQLKAEHIPKAKEPNYQKWAEHIDKMQRIDGITFEEIEDLIRWCQQDNFWKSNILSTQKLREKYEQLYAAKARDKGSGKSDFEKKLERLASF